VPLAAHPQGLDAETLINAPWPSLKAEAPHASLKTAVSRLRKWLDCPDAARVAEGRVSPHPQRVSTDVAAFEQVAQAGSAEAAVVLQQATMQA